MCYDYNLLCIFSMFFLVIMKKVLSIFLWVFITLSIFFLWSGTFAQQGVKWGITGINVTWSCLKWMWKWCFEYDKIIWIADEKAGKTTAKTLSQDVVLAATYMVGTVLTIVIIYCGLMYIFAARDGRDVNKYKKWLINAAIWALLVWWAYAIVRLIQYIAKW